MPTTLSPAPGRRYYLRVDDINERQKPLMVPVVVLDTRAAFGRVDALVEPVGGKGRQWVQRKRLTAKRS